jgi:hypothetical protein
MKGQFVFGIFFLLSIALSASPEAFAGGGQKSDPPPSPLEIAQAQARQISFEVYKEVYQKVLNESGSSNKGLLPQAGSTVTSDKAAQAAQQASKEAYEKYMADFASGTASSGGSTSLASGSGTTDGNYGTGGTGDSTGASTVGFSSEGMTQQSALLDATDLARYGGQEAATIAVDACAEGANTLGTDKSASGVLIDSCLNSFNTAEKMKAMEAGTAANAGIEASGELSANENLLDADSSEQIFADLKEKYGIDKDEFTAKLLEARGNPELLGTQEALDELFGGKVSRSDVEAAINAAKGLSPEEKQKILAASRLSGVQKDAALEYVAYLGKKAFAGNLAQTSLKKALQDKLAKAPATAAASSESAKLLRQPAGTSAPMYANLQPMENPPFEMGDTDQASLLGSQSMPGDGLSLFDVVHLKYREKLEALTGVKIVVR